MTFRLPSALSLLGLSLLLGGCSVIPRPDGAVHGPFYVPANVHGVERMPDTVRRVALLPCAGADPVLTESTLRDLDRALAASLVASARAEVAAVSREDLPRLGARRGVLSTGALPPDLLARVASETGADAVLFVDVTAYSPYPPLVLGLRSRLVELSSGKSLWNFDNLFSANIPAVANSARAHIRGRSSATLNPADFSYTALQNPLAFADYATAALWATLPPRVITPKVSP